MWDAVYTDSWLEGGLGQLDAERLNDATAGRLVFYWVQVSQDHDALGEGTVPKHFS